MFRLRSCLYIFIILFNFTSAASAFEGKILPKPEKVSEHVYAWIGPFGGPNVKNKGYRMNMAFVVGKDAVAVIDTGFYPAMAEEMISHIKAITKKPIKYAINTNSQAHRMYGNAAFHKRGIPTYAHEKEIRRMQENANNYALLHEMVMKFKNSKLPELAQHAITKPMKMDLGGGVVLDVDFYKASHTPMSLIVNISVDNIVYAGDILFAGRLPGIVPGGNNKQWIESYDNLKKYGDVTFIPGHGTPGKLAAFKHATYDYISLLDSHMTKMLEQGVGMTDSIRRLDQSAFSDLANYKDLAGRNANLAYQEAEIAAF